MRLPNRRRFVGTGVASAAALSLFAGVLVAGASPDLPVHAPHGVGEPPPIDGGRAGGSTDRYEVVLDAAAVMAATIVPDGETVAEHGPVAPGRVSEGAGPAQEDPARVAVPPGAPTPDDVARALASIDDRVESVTHVIDDIYQVAGQDLDVEQVRAIAGVLATEVEGISYPTGDPHLPVQWGLENTGRTFGGITGTPGLDIGFAEASQIATGSGVVVAVVDSGIQTDHPDLSGRFWRNPGEICDNGVDDDRNGFVDDCRGWDFVHQDPTVYDPQGDNAHGTHVAGIVAATTDNGVGVASLAPGATIMPVKVFDGGSAPVTRIAAAIEYAVANGADVINLSLGGDASWSLERALDAAAAADVLVVAAAGNEGRDIDTQPTYPASYPHANLVSVGSHAADGRVSSFSNTGAVSVDVFAPGEMIAATYPGSSYSYMSGTSMAAPMVSAMAATIAQHRATTSAAALHPAILDAVVTDGAYRGRSVTGGRVFAPLALGDAPVGSADVTATFTGLADLQPGTVSSTITAGLGDAVAEGVDLELLLARWYDDAPHAVVGHDMTVAVDGASRATATDVEGRLVLELTDTTRSSLAEGTLRIDVATDLPAGQYALAVLPVPDDGTARRPAAAFFVVGDPTPVPEEPPADDPVPDDGTSPSPDDGTAPAPEPDAGAPPPGGGTHPDPTGPGTLEPAPGTAPDPHSPPPPPATGDDPGGSPDPGAGTSPDPGVGTAPPPSGGTSPDPGAGTAPSPDGMSPDPGAGTAPPPGGGTAPEPDDGGSPDPGAGDEPAEPAPPVWPTSGPSDGGTWVSVKGSFDPFGTYYVHIGDQILRPVVMMSSVLQVVTTASAARGPQDVVVHGPGGVEVVRYLAAYTFVQDGDAPPPPGDSTSPPPDDGSAPPPDDGSAPPPDDGSAPPPDDGSAPPPDGDAPARTPMTAGSPFMLPDGLTLDRIVSGPLAGLTADAWTSTRCVSSPCDGVRVG